MVQFFEKRIFCCEILSCEFVFKTILIAVLQNVKKIQFYKHSAVYLYRLKFFVVLTMTLGTDYSFQTVSHHYFNEKERN
jgi:uncharacterized membrane protein YjdF